MFILAAFTVAVIYIISAAVHISRGVSRTLEVPEHSIRLQVLNGCGISGLATRISDLLAGYHDNELEVKIVDTDNFDLHQVTESFVISRLENKKSAERLWLAVIGLTPRSAQ